MKIIKLIKCHNGSMSEDKIKNFLYKNLPTEMLNGLEYDDPKTIERTLKLLGIQAGAGTQVDDGAVSNNMENASAS